ncbi:MAG TPA: hypothetical protein VFZ14_12050 [Burkholderiales bacterium]|nr:hypothetical protein [Burkholderiales bacterium]
MAKATKQKKAAAKLEWRVTRNGVRFTLKRGRQSALKDDGSVRTFRTRDAASRVAKALNGG